MLAVLPTVLLVMTVLWVLCLLQWVHGSAWSLSGLWLFGVLWLGCIVCWLRLLQYGQHTSKRQNKLIIAWRLIGLLSFAFSMTFIMIAMYHWMSADGHVHGASGSGSGQLSDSAVIGPDGQVDVFLGLHQRGYQLPVVAQLADTHLTVSAGVSSNIVLLLENKADVETHLRLSARVAPGVIKHQVHYALLYADQTLTLAPKEQKRLQFPLVIDAHFPSLYQPFAITHFVFGADTVDAWQKMQGPIKLINSTE